MMDGRFRVTRPGVFRGREGVVVLSHKVARTKWDAGKPNRLYTLRLDGDSGDEEVILTRDGFERVETDCLEGRSHHSFGIFNYGTYRQFLKCEYCGEVRD